MSAVAGPFAPAEPLPRRLGAWMRERFPAAHLPLFAVLYLLALLYGRALAHPAQPLAVGLPDILGFAAVYGFFLALRVADEHKDYALDCVAHPQRVLQRGLVSLRLLRVLGSAAVVTQLGISLALDGGVGDITRRWLAVAGWSALMTFEFFAPAWLRRRPILYAALHMAVMPFAILWMAQMGAGVAPLPSAALTLALLSYVSGFAFEVARKTRAPADERPLVDSYTRVLGVRGAALALGLLLAGVCVTLLLLLLQTTGAESPPAIYAALLSIPAVAAPALVAFARQPTSESAKRVQLNVGLAMLFGYLLPLGALLFTRGLAWR